MDAVPLVGAAPRLTAVLTGVFAGVTGGTARAFEMLDAVGLLSLSAASGLSVFFFAGGGGMSCALRALASDAAVGAKSPEAGVLGRAVDAGVLGRAVDGVFERAGVMGGRTDALEDGREPGPGADLTFFTLVVVRSGGGVEVDADNAGAPWKEVGGDFAGVRVSFAVVVVVVEGRLAVALALEGVTGVRVLAAAVVDGRVAAGLRAGAAGVGSTCAGSAGGSSGAAGAGTSAASAGVLSMTDAGSCKSAASGLGDASGVGRAGFSGATSRTGGAGGGEVAGSGDFAVSVSVSAFGRGGHSRFTTSSLATSPVWCESGVPVRDGGAPVSDCRLVCCSNRPMRFATL